jgi:hypothetical protein
MCSPSQLAVKRLVGAACKVVATERASVLAASMRRCGETGFC